MVCGDPELRSNTRSSHGKMRPVRAEPIEKLGCEKETLASFGLELEGLASK